MDETLDADDDSPLPSSAGPETLLTGESADRRFGLEHDLDVADDPIHIGRYVVLRRVGEGGMGVVYAAYDNELERRLAIKLVRLARGRADSRARVRREAQAMARLSHPNVVQVYEVGEFEGQIYVAMEFVTGPTLAEWTRAQEPGAERWREILAKFVEVGRGLAAAHAARIIHRDFKPANAIVGDDGRVRVLDFGIARAVEPGEVEVEAERSHPGDDDRDADEPEGRDLRGVIQTGADPLATPLTRTVAQVGTPAYMSPEQFEHRAIDPRSDQFSFCVALYEALYGERPFAGGGPTQVMFSVLAGEIRPAPARAQVPGWIREILLRGLETEPTGRWPSMTELLDALGRDPARQRRRRIRAAIFGSVALAALVGFGLFARELAHDTAIAEAKRLEALEQERIAQAREAQAQAERDRALVEARASARRARDTARVLAARGLGTEPDVAVALLRDVEQPAETPGWRSATVAALQHPVSRRVLRAHTDRISYLDVSGDGRWLATASFDGTARLWPRAGGEPAVLDHDDHVLTAGFDHSSKRLVTSSRDTTAAVWTLPEIPTDGRAPAMPEPLILRGHRAIVWSAEFSFDGTKVVTASRDGSVRIWPLDDPSAVAVHETDAYTLVWWAEFSRDGKWVVAASSDGLARVWSVEDPNRPAIVLEGHRDSVGDVHFSPMMNTIVTASHDGTVRLFDFDPRDPGPVRAHAILEHDAEVHRARFSVDGLRVVTASRDRTAKVWTLDKDGRPRPDLPPMVFDAGDGVVWSADLDPTGTLLAVGVGGGTVQVWPLRGGPKLTLIGHTTDVFRVRFSADGSRLYSGSSDGTVREWDTNWGAVARTLDDSRGRGVELEQRGRVLVSAKHDANVQVWPIYDPGPALSVAERPAVLEGHRGRSVIALDGSPRLLATADDQQAQVRLWRIAGTWVLDPDHPLATLETRGHRIRTLALDDAGALLAAATLDGTILLWKLDALDRGGSLDPEPLRLAVHSSTSSVMSVVGFSQAGDTLASSGGDGKVRLWDRAALESATGDDVVPTTMLEQDARIYTMSFAADGRQIATAGVDYSSRVWQLDRPDDPTHVLDHAYLVNAVSFDPAGELLATACSDSNVYLWDLDQPEAPTLLSGAAGEVRDVSFDPTGRLVAAASYDGRLRVWSVEGGDPLEFDAGFPLYELAFVDNGRRIAAGGAEPGLMLWYLGDDLGVDALRDRLATATQLCLSPDQRVRFIGESHETASEAHAACRQFYP